MGYLGSALTKEEANLFVAKYNKIDERVCIGVCGKKFISEGAHNRKCPRCKAKERLNEDNQIKFDIPVYKTYGTFKRMNAFRGEVE